MCEFKVFLDGKKIFEEAVYVKSKGNSIVLRNILGEQKVFDECLIQEVNVASEELNLTSTSSTLGRERKDKNRNPSSR
jgi:predicted RNA-binding protein